MTFFNYFFQFENIFKYGFVIFNFLIIAFLIIYNKHFRKDEIEERKNLLLIIAHPDDESM